MKELSDSPLNALLDLIAKAMVKQDIATECARRFSSAPVTNVEFGPDAQAKDLRQKCPHRSDSSAPPSKKVPLMQSQPPGQRHESCLPQHLEAYP